MTCFNQTPGLWLQNDLHSLSHIFILYFFAIMQNRKVAIESVISACERSGHYIDASKSAIAPLSELLKSLKARVRNAVHDIYEYLIFRCYLSICEFMYICLISISYSPTYLFSSLLFFSSLPLLLSLPFLFLSQVSDTQANLKPIAAVAIGHLIASLEPEQGSKHLRLIAAGLIAGLCLYSHSFSFYNSTHTYLFIKLKSNNYIFYLTVYRQGIIFLFMSYYSTYFSSLLCRFGR